MNIIYMDGVFDLFHYGHIEAIKQCKKIGGENSKIIIGVISDSDVESYKRTPIFNTFARTEIIKNLRLVDKVISPAPLILSRKFIEDNGITRVVHSFANEEDFEKQKEQHSAAIELGIFQKINYTNTISTTNIIQKIKNY